MKRLSLSILFSISMLMAVASDGFEVKYSQPAAGTHQLMFTLGDYSLSDVVLQGTNYTRIVYEGKIVTQRKGFAELPYLNSTVMLDPQKNVDIEVIPGAYEEISLAYPLVPSRGVIYRSQDPASVPYAVEPRSLTDAWYPVNLAENTRPFIIRDIRGTSVYVYPFQYNAVRQVLRVYKNITVQLVENDSPSINPLLKEPVKIVREMDAVYNSVFINYASSNRDNLTIGEFGDIHVIVTARDEEAIQPYVQWKREKGFNVSVEVVPANTTVNNNVQAAYDNNNDILYVLMVGDWADVKSATSGSGRPQDPQVGTVVGDDDFADIAVGRFSANSPADVTVQVNKVINYEKMPEMAGEWYDDAVGIASAEGAGIGDDGESDIQHETVIYNDKLDPFTYNTFTQVFDPGASTTMVSNAVNAGTTVINYTGHGWGDGWGTTGFSSTNVAALTNGNKLPFIISVACNNGDFDLGTCFAESWLRKDGGGAIMFMGASISQPWAEPMRGQDYFMDILIGGYDYSAHPGQNGISTSEQRTTFGAIIFNGLTLMCTESGGSSDWETAKTWNMFGDPSVQARTAAPQDINLSSNLVMVGISFTTMVTSADGPVANAMVTLSQGELFFTGVTDASGSVTIEHTLDPGTARLVVTAFNTETIYEELNVIPPDGPYVTITAVEIGDADENGNGLLDYGETVKLTISLTNVGSVDAEEVNVSISSADEYMAIGDAEEFYGKVAVGEIVTITNGFEVSSLESLPDQHVAMFSLDADGEAAAREVWSSSFVLPGHAPVLEMPAYLIDDAAGNNNGRLDPGETAFIQITAANEGSADAYNVSATLSSTSEYITIGNSPLVYGDLAAGTETFQSFEVTMAEGTPTGHPAPFIFEMTGDMNIAGSGEFTEYVGQIPVLMLDWDLNHNSLSAVEQCLNNLEVGYEISDVIPADRNLYASIFIFLGTYPDNHVMTAEEGEIFAEYLDMGGNIYMEGADTWYYDQQFNPSPLHQMFGIQGVEDGSGDLSLLQGQSGSMAEGMTFSFGGDNSYIDHISEVPPAQMMFMNSAPSYGAGVSFDAGTYRTVGFSFELGGLTDGEMTKDDLMMHILEFFGIEGIWTDVSENEPAPSLVAGSYPNPFRNETAIHFATKEACRITLDIMNINGQVISRLFDAGVGEGNHEIRWNGTDNSGNRAAHGVYFYRLQTGKEIVTGKIMLMD